MSNKNILEKIKNILNISIVDYRLRKLENQDEVNSKEIKLIVLLGGIGDTILALDLLHLMLDEKFEVLVYKSQFELVDNFLPRNSIKIYESDSINYLDKNIILLKSTLSFKLMLINKKFRINKIVFNPLYDGISIVVRFKNFISSSSKKNFYSRRHIKNIFANMLNVDINKRIRFINEKHNINNRNIGIHVSGSIEIKRLKVTLLQEIIGSRNDLIFYLFGSNDDKSRYNILSENINVVSLIGKTNLSNLSDYLLKMDLVICPDSMIMHYCDYLGVPVIALMGNALAETYGPFNSKKNTLSRAPDCSPCSRTTCDKFHGYSCIQDISSAEILDKLNSLIPQI